MTARRNRPDTFAGLRELAQTIAVEAAIKDGVPIKQHGRTVTVIEAILRTWAASKNPKLQAYFVEIGYGKVPMQSQIEVQPMQFRFVFDDVIPGVDDDG